MSNVFLTPSIILREALMILGNMLSFTQNVNREYSAQFAASGAKVGAIINARKPVRYLGRSGQDLQIEASVESYVPIVLSTLFGVDTCYSSADLSLSIEEFSDRFLKPAMARIANKIDEDGLQLFMDINRLVNAGASASSYGTPGLLNSGSATVGQVQGQILTAGAILTESGVPYEERALVLDPISQVSAVTPMLTLFNPQQDIARTFKTGSIGNALGFEWATDPNVVKFTPMSAGSVTALAAAPNSGDSVLSVTGTAGVVPRGTVLTITGVYAINPQSRQSTGRPMQFVVTSDTVIGSTGSLPIYPAYIPSGQQATCTGTPANNAAISIASSGAVGSGPVSQNLAYHKNAFALVTADLQLPGGVDMAERCEYQGISMRMVRQYDIRSDQFITRFDVLYGWKTVYPDLAVRISG